MTNILTLVVKFLPMLISIAEGLFSWKTKSGTHKKEWVSSSLKRVVDTVAANSTGGQALTWEHIGPSVDMLIDASVALANKAGAFGGLDETLRNMTGGAE